MGLAENLEALLAAGKDDKTLRFALASSYQASGRAAEAVDHARAALCFDPEYSAAWKLLGKALTALGRNLEAEQAYQQGIAAAQQRGDKQAAKEMQVFLRRLERRRRDGR